MRGERATFTLALATAVAVCGAGGSPGTRAGPAPGGRTVGDPVAPVEHAVWEQRHAPGAPDRPTLFYDSVRQRVRGFVSATPPAIVEWTGDAWSATPTAPYPGRNSPGETVWDAGRARLVVFEGDSTDFTAPVDLWEWDGGSWSRGVPAPPLTLRSVSYDEARRQIVLFGSRVNGGYGETWTLDAGGWRQAAAAGVVPLGGGRVLVYDALRGVTLQVGEDDCVPGCNPKLSSAVWEWDGLRWTHPTPAASPPPGNRGLLAYDAARARTVLYRDGEVWEWDGATWWQQRPIGVPRALSSTAFDVARRRVVAAAGSDTWLYWTFAGACTTSDHCDTALCDEGICCAVTCGTCSRCDTTGSGCTPVRGADDADSCTGDRTCDPGAACRSKPGRSCAHGSDCASGQCAAGVCCRAQCAPYGCGVDGACRTACVTSAECAAPAVCRAGACGVPDTACTGAHVATSNTGVTRDCTPFACDAAAGACRATCATSDDCAEGFLCDGAGVCVSAPPLRSGCAARGSGSGGGERGAGTSAPAAMLGLAFLAAARRRRRFANPRRTT